MRPRPHRTPRLTLAVLALAAAGCPPDRPKAPPLTTEAVFQNDEIGLRFLAPAGWIVQAKALLPDGPLRKPIMLVIYQRDGGESPADFKVQVADVPEGTRIETFLAEHRVGAEQWTIVPPVQETEVNGAPVTRCVQRAARGKEELRREVTAFRRGGRVYLFLVTFSATDGASRDAGRTAVGSVTWAK